MKRLSLAVLLGLVAVAPLAGIAAAEVNLTISSVDVTPEQAVPDEKVRIEATIGNLESSDAGFVVERVALLDRRGDDPRVYDDVKTLGTIPPDETRSVALSTRFRNPGTYDLLVRVWGEESDTGQPRVVQYPVTIEVTDRTPQVDVDANDTAVGVTRTGAVTVVNSLDVSVEDAEVTVDGEDVTITNRRAVLATLESGETQTVQFDYRPRSAGRHTLEATLSYTTLGGTTRDVTEAVVFRSERVRPQLAVDVNDTIAGVEARARVTLANGVGTAIRNVELTLDGEEVTVQNGRAVFSRVPDGESVTTSFAIEPATAGEHVLNATLSYTTGDGIVRTVSETAVVEADPLRDRVTLDVRTSGRGDARLVVVDVLNQGNVPVSNVTVRGRSTNASLGLALVGEVPSGESETVRLNATLSGERATVDVDATYDVGSSVGRATSTVSLSRTPGTIALTGVQVVPEDGRLHISGSASNLGTTDAESVLISVVEADRVTPAEPNREYFVGPVPASDFVSFDVYAAVTGNVSTVPLEVRYVVDGVRQTRLVDVDVSSASRALSTAGLESPARRGIPGGPLALFGVAVVLVVAVLAVRAWRKRRAGD